MRRFPVYRPAAWVGPWFLLALLVSETRADLLYFAKGGRAQAAAEVDGDAVRVDSPAGPFTFRRSDFLAIVPGNWPEREWPGRRRKALAGDAAERFRAAWWALENGLTPEAAAMLREVLRADPKHEPAGRMVALLDRLDRPCPDPDTEPLRRALGVRVEAKGGPHVVLLHQHDDAEAAERVAILERVVVTYYLWFAAQGVDLPPPARKMASAWLADRTDYRAFLRREHAGTFLATMGYYHPTLDAVVAYDSRSDGPIKSGRQAINARARELDRLRDFVGRMPPKARARIVLPSEPARTATRSQAEELLDRFARDLSRQNLLWELERRSVDLGTAAHEMTHQLMANSRLYARHDDLPTWLHEGFAAQFEVIRGGRWAGLGRAHDLRLPDWRSIKPPPSLAPLVNDAGFGRGYRRDLYAQAWALVYYLRKRHPEEFLAYLDLLRNPARVPRPAVSHRLDTFQAAFRSPLPDLESDWHRFLADLTTPLESHAPAASPPEPSRVSAHRD